MQRLFAKFFPEMASYLPLLPLLNNIVSASSAVERTNAVLSLARYGASTTSMQLDDELISHLSSMLGTAEGQAFIRWFAERASSAIYAMEPPSASACCDAPCGDDE